MVRLSCDPGTCPGPIVGAGLPGVVAACAGLFSPLPSSIARLRNCPSGSIKASNLELVAKSSAQGWAIFWCVRGALGGTARLANPCRLDTDRQVADPRAP